MDKRKWPIRFRTAMDVIYWNDSELRARLAPNGIGLDDRTVRRWFSGKNMIPGVVLDYVEAVAKVINDNPPPYGPYRSHPPPLSDPKAFSDALKNMVWGAQQVADLTFTWSDEINDGYVFPPIEQWVIELSRKVCTVPVPSVDAIRSEMQEMRARIQQS